MWPSTVTGATLREGPHPQRGNPRRSCLPNVSGGQPTDAYPLLGGLLSEEAGRQFRSVGFLFTGLAEMLSAPNASVEVDLDAGDDREGAPRDAVP